MCNNVDEFENGKGEKYKKSRPEAASEAEKITRHLESQALLACAQNQERLR